MFEPMRSVSSMSFAEVLLSIENRVSIKYNILRTSPQLPFAILRNLMKFASLPASEPSAMLFITDIAALRIWSLKPQSLILSVIA